MLQSRYGDDIMFEYLCKMFGKDNIIKLNFNSTGLPIYMNSYEFASFKIFGKTFIFMKYKKDYNLNGYLKHSKVIENKYNCETVLVLNNSKEVQRLNLISNAIMFIEKDKYIFMPSIGLVFTKPKEEVNEIKLTSQENIVALSFLYLNDEITVKDIISSVNINKMTISRAINKLESINLVKHEIKGKIYCYSLCHNKKSYIDNLLKIMKNPIKQRVIVEENSIKRIALYAGLTAISNSSMLGDDIIKTYAISYDQAKSLYNTKTYIKGLIIKPNESILEIWDYDPNIYSKNGNAEMISVIKTIDIDDERVENEIESIKEKY